PGNQIHLDWTAPAPGPPGGVDSYNIFRASTVPSSPCPAASSFTMVGSVTGTTVAFDDAGLAFNTKYCYFVRSVSAGEESGDSNTDSATTSAGAAAAPKITDVHVTANGG